MDFQLPTPDNDNWGVCSPTWTASDVMQWVRTEKTRMKRELAADFRLRACPKHRLDWEITIAIEKCTRWHCYGERDC